MVRAWLAAAALAVVLTGAVRPAHAQDEDPAGEFIFGDTRTALGYAIYRVSFWELGYTFGFTPWISQDGRGRVMLSGLEFDENRGPIINFVMRLLALMGVSEWRYTGSSGAYDYYVYDPAAAARQRSAINETFAHAPLSMSVHAYSEALGSQADGFVIDGSFRDPIGTGLPAVVWAIGLHVGWLRSNGAWRGDRFESVWGGANFDLRVTFFEYMGLWLRVGAWFGGPSANGFALPIELGPEILIGNRFVIRGLAIIDPMRPDALPEGIGMRLEAGVRL